MAANITAVGFPTIVSCRIFQKSTAEPGIIHLHTHQTLNEIPDLTTITITSDGGFNGSWPARVVKRARHDRDLLVWTLHDSRWMLNETIMAESFNRRDDMGRIEAATDKTITELWAEIATSSGLPITVGTVPSLKPPAPWKGKTAREAADQLLCDTFCFMLWDAVNATYRIESGGSGTAPTATRIYGPGPSQKINQIEVESSPITYESELDAEAVLKDANGDVVSLGTLVDAIDLFKGFGDVSSAADRSRYQQSAFRLWKVTQTTFPETLTQERLVLLSHRGVSLASSANSHLSAAAHPAAFDNAMVNFPEFQFPDREYTIGGTGLMVVEGTELMYSDKPILFVNDDGDIVESIKIRAAYHVEDGGDLKRLQELRTIHGTGDTLRVLVPWIRPFSSNLHDAPSASSNWESDLSVCADALDTKYTPKRESMMTSDIVGHFTGQVGAVLYEGSSGYDGRLSTTWALNHVPSEWRSMRG